jgi:outer membrane protein assembly factor BamB
MSRLAVALFLALAVSLSLSAADDWPQFRGPKRDGLSTDTGLLKSWPEKAGPPLAWKSVGVGIGFSSVAVAGDRVFTMGDLKDGCHAFAVRRDNGEQLWKAKIGDGGGNYKGPRCTPTVDGENVYVLGQMGDLVCLTAAGGKEVWRKSLPKDFSGQNGGWNYTESVLIDGDKLICTPGGSKATMVALNKKTGEPIWKGVVGKSGDTAGYASPVVAEIGGVRQYITLMANGLVGFDAKDGKMLWRYGAKGERFGANTANIPTPIVRGEFVFASAGYGRGGALVRIKGSGGAFTAEEVYWNQALNNKHGGVILIGDTLYGDSDDSGYPWAADFMTGKVKWKRSERGKGDGSASITAADGMLYVRYQNGWASLVNPAGGYAEVSTFKIQNGSGDCWAHPVVVGGKLYLRERDTIWCHDVKAK